MIEIHTKTTPKIKFQSEQRINVIQSGHIYMKELDYFRRLEQDEGDLDVGDMRRQFRFQQHMKHLLEFHVHYVLWMVQNLIM